MLGQLLEKYINVGSHLFWVGLFHRSDWVWYEVFIIRAEDYNTEYAQLVIELVSEAGCRLSAQEEIQICSLLSREEV